MSYWRGKKRNSEDAVQIILIISGIKVHYNFGNYKYYQAFR